MLLNLKVMGETIFSHFVISKIMRLKKIFATQKFNSVIENEFITQKFSIDSLSSYSKISLNFIQEYIFIYYVYQLT